MGGMSGSPVSTEPSAAAFTTIRRDFSRTSVNASGRRPVPTGVTRAVPLRAAPSRARITTRSHVDDHDAPDVLPRRGNRVSEAAGIARAPVDLRRTEDLEAAYRAHAGELERFALRQLRDPGAASDVVQEVFVRAWRHADRYDATVASLRVWLFTIARNAVIDHVRHARSRPSTPTAPADLSLVSDRPGRAGRDDFSDDLVTAWFVEEALTRLGDDQRSAIVETSVRGRPYAEVAAEQGVPIGTLRSRVFYGLKNLRQIMDDMGVPL